MIPFGCGRLQTCWQSGGDLQDQCGLIASRERPQRSTGSRRSAPERDPTVEPRSSGTIATPIMGRRNVLATVGMTDFTSALSRPEPVQRYVPLVRALASNIASSVASLR